jgi:hypothetical protein
VNKRIVTSLLLLIVVSVLLVFFFLSEEKKTGTEIITLSDIEAESIRHIVIQRKSREKIEFILKQGHWFMSLPFEARANVTRIEAMLRLLRLRSFAQVDRIISPLASYQLDPAAITLHMDKHEFHFGTTSPLDGRRYVSFNNTIHLVNDNLFHQLHQSPMFFVSPRLIPAEEIITSIQIADQVVSKIGFNWTLSPLNNDIAEEQLINLADAWQTGRARQVAQYVPRNSNEKIIVTLRSGRTAQFDIVSITPTLILGRADLALQYHLDSDVSEKLFLPDNKPNEDS